MPPNTDKKSRNEIIGALWTRGFIRDAVYEFAGHHPRSGRTALGPQWHMIGPTAREAVITHEVWRRVVCYTGAPTESVIMICDMRAARDCFEEELAAIGFTVFDT